MRISSPISPAFIGHQRRSVLLVRLLAPCVVKVGCATFFALHLLASSLHAAPPNIVFIMADDLGWADVGFHNGVTPTPQLDSLAKTSLELTQHYVAPVCTPTRVGLLTGRVWSRFGVTTPLNERALPPATVTLASALKSAGYDTCLTGKWHLGSKPEWGPNHFGFEHSYGSLAGGVSPWGHFYKKGPYSITWHRNEELIEEKGHVTDLLTHEAIEWLEQRSRRQGQSKPFFLYVPYTAVHLPVKEPKAWLDKVPESIQGEVPRHYAACTMHMDDSVGKILKALDNLHLSDQTLVVFTSDNGGSTAENNDVRYPHDTYPQGRLPGDNRPLRGKKGDLYEGGIRVPTLVRWPRPTNDLLPLRAGKCEQPIQITDWMPTFCKLAGYVGDVDLHWDGRDIMPALQGKAIPDRTLYWAGTNFRSAAIRKGNWKLIDYGGRAGAAASKTNSKPTELFDLGRDPGEKTNVAEQMPDRVAELRAEMERMSALDVRR